MSAGTIKYPLISGRVEVDGEWAPGGEVLGVAMFNHCHKDYRAFNHLVMSSMDVFVQHALPVSHRVCHVPMHPSTKSSRVSPSVCRARCSFLSSFVSSN